MARSILDRLRAICMALPEAEERETWELPTFRVRGKIYAMAPGGTEMWCKAPRGSQELLVEADPARFFRPPYLGHKGWLGVRLGRGTDWVEIRFLVRRSYRLVAPRKLATTVEENAC